MNNSNAQNENFTELKSSRIFPSSSNKIACVENGRIVFDKTKLSDILNQPRFESDSDENLPIAIVTVLGSNKNEARNLHTEWIVRYHEPNEQISFQTDFVEKETMDTINDGMFIWPKLFKVKQKLSNKIEEVLCLIVYVHDDLLLDNYAVCISSKTILFKGSEKDKLENVFKNEQLKQFLRNTNFIVASSGMMLNAKQKRLKDIETFFLEKVYEQRDITPKRNCMEQKITAANLVDHLEYVAIMFNSISENKLEKECTYPDVLDQGLKHNDASTDSESSTTEVLSIIEKDEKVADSKMRIQLTNWIENELSMYTVNTLGNHLVTDLNSSRKTIDALQDLLISFNFHLKNMFSNFICLDKNDDEGKLTNFSDNAGKHLEDGYHNIKAQLSDYIFDKDDLEKIRLKLITDYVSDNNKIVKHEETLCSHITNQILNEYRKVLSFSSGKTEAFSKKSELDAVHKSVLQLAIASFTRCLDYEGKSNFVFEKSIEEMKVTMQNIFEEQTKNLDISPKLPISPEESNIKAYLEEFSKIENNLEKYSTNDLVDLHKKWEIKLCENIFPEEAKQELQLKLDSRLIYLTEKQNELLETSHLPHQQLNALCFLIKHDYIQVTAISPDENIIPIWHSSENVTKSNKFPAKVVFRKNTQKFYFPHQLDQFTKRDLDQNFTHGNISSCITNQLDNEKLSMGVVTYFLTSIKNKACQQIPEHEFPQAIIIVPSVFDKASRRLLREAARQAKFRKIFIFNESSLLAYHFITENIHKTNHDLIVMINVGLTGVRIEIYQGFPADKIQMVGLALEQWKDNLSLSAEDQLPVPFLKIIKEVFQKFIGSLPSSIIHFRKLCFISYEKDSWSNSLRTVFHGVDNTVVRMSFYGQIEKANLVMKVIERLAGNPVEIRNRILDYLVNLD